MISKLHMQTSEAVSRPVELWQWKLDRLQQCICDLLLANQRLRMELMDSRMVQTENQTGGPMCASHNARPEGGKPPRDLGAMLEERNKALVLEAFDTLFNERNYKKAEQYWSPNYIQHSAHIEPGRDGLFNLVRSAPVTLKYEPGLIVAEDDYVIVHGRFSGRGSPVNWIAADILRIEDGILLEHWDVLQDEATQEQSKSKKPMFGTAFPKEPEER